MAPRLRYPELAPEGVAALRSLEHYLNTGTSLSAVLLEMIRLRASLLNDCDFCKHIHDGELRKHNEPEGRIEALAHWQDSDAFTPRERAALAWTDSLTNVQKTHIADEEFQAVSHFFKDKDLVDLTLAVTSINAWNRLGIAFRPGWNPGLHAQNQATSSAAKKAAQPGLPAQQDDSHSAVDDDGGKVSAE